MSNLIDKDDLGNWGVKGLPWENLYVGRVITQEIHEKLYGCLWKLMEYEDTGISPEQIEQIDNLYLEKCKEVNRLNAELAEHQQLEEKGLLLRLPVAVGGKVYEIIEETVPSHHFYISEHEVQDVSAKAVKYADDWCEYDCAGLYLTRAEAEQALLQMGRR